MKRVQYQRQERLAETCFPKNQVFPCVPWRLDALEESEGEEPVANGQSLPLWGGSQKTRKNLRDKNALVTFTLSGHPLKLVVKGAALFPMCLRFPPPSPGLTLPACCSPILYQGRRGRRVPLSPVPIGTQP